MRHLLDMTVGELSAQIEAAGEKPYRTRQIVDWVYRRGASGFAAMSDLPAILRERLAGEYAIFTAAIAARADAQDGTTKLLLDFAQRQAAGDERQATSDRPEESEGMLEAGNPQSTIHNPQSVECVLIPSGGKFTACVSTQIGCQMACTFCASGQHGMVRDLTGGEIVEQALQLWHATGRKVSRVVFMGMGEPLANYEATLAAVRAMIDPQRMGLSARSITVSTVGLPKGIRRLAAEELPITLAISLHAPTDALRRQIMPRAATVPIADIVAAAQEFFQSRHRELTLEYVLLEGVNDTNVCAEALSRIARQIRCNVNIIRYNPVAGAEYKSPSSTAAHAFAARLRDKGVNVQVRRSLGIDASAACGQLRTATAADAAGKAGTE